MDRRHCIRCGRFLKEDYKEDICEDCKLREYSLVIGD
jgi:hypothetical protein